MCVYVQPEIDMPKKVQHFRQGYEARMKSHNIRSWSLVE